MVHTDFDPIVLFQPAVGIAIFHSFQPAVGIALLILFSIEAHEHQ